MATHYFLRADFVLLKTARPDRQNYRRTKAEALSCRCKVTQIGIFFPNPLHNNTLIHTHKKRKHTLRQAREAFMYTFTCLDTHAHSWSKFAYALELANSQTWSTLLTSRSEWLWQIGVCWWIAVCILCVTTLGSNEQVAPKVTSAHWVTEMDAALRKQRERSRLHICMCIHVTRVFTKLKNQEA